MTRLRGRVPQIGGVFSGAIFLPLEPVFPVHNGNRRPNDKYNANCPEHSLAFDNKRKIEFRLVSFNEQINKEPCAYQTKNGRAQPTTTQLQIKISSAESWVRDVFVLGIFHWVRLA